MNFRRAIYRLIQYGIALLAIIIVTSCAIMNETKKSGDCQNDPLRFLALGDSYTIGTGVEPYQSWPVQLAELVRDAGFRKVEPVIIARNGWSTGDLLEGITDAEIEDSYDFVSLLIGVNNQYRGYPESEYRSEFRVLLKIAGEYADGRWDRVVVLSIPDWGAAPFAEGLDRDEIGAEIDAFNAINLEEAKAVGAHYLDVTSSSRRVFSEPDLAAEDGLHLSGKMYAEWAQLILDLLTPVLTES